MKRQFRYILQTTFIVMLSALISNTVLAEIVFEDKIELEEKETEEEENNCLESCPQNVENVSIGSGGSKEERNIQLNISLLAETLFTALLPNTYCEQNSNSITKHTIAFYIRYCSLIVYS